MIASKGYSLQVCARPGCQKSEARIRERPFRGNCSGVGFTDRGERVDEQAETDVVRFGGFRFERRRRCLLRESEGGLTSVPIGSRALEVLGLLIDRHGDLVLKDEILSFERSASPMVVEFPGRSVV